jgi:RNA polymerase sigma-70 factor (ECF subfamily)
VTPAETDATTFAELRPLLFSLAYRMLGSVSEAEDVVQDAFLRWRRALQDGVAIASPKAYLSAVVTRLAIDELRSARVRRESYSGQWLPEPLLTDEGAGDPAAHAEQADSLSMAFLLLLERLTPAERAVFLLHDVFGYGYDEVSDIVGRTEANCRQIARRARQRVEEGKPRFEASKRERDELAARFFAAAGEGDVDGLVGLLAQDVVVVGDGGGKVPQWGRPIVGAERVARLFANIAQQMARIGATFELREVNGQPGVIVRASDDRVVNVMALEVEGGEIHAIRSVINPDKLEHIGPVADAWALLRELRDTRAAG